LLLQPRAGTRGTLQLGVLSNQQLEIVVTGGAAIFVERHTSLRIADFPAVSRNVGSAAGETAAISHFLA